MTYTNITCICINVQSYIRYVTLHYIALHYITYVLYMYMHMCMCICIWICICVCLYLYVCVYVNLYVYVLYMYCICISTYEYMYIYIWLDILQKLSKAHPLQGQTLSHGSHESKPHGGGTKVYAHHLVGLVAITVSCWESPLIITKRSKR